MKDIQHLDGSRDNTNTKQKTSVLFHIMPKSRQTDFKNGVRNKSYGCVNLPTDALNYMINNNAVGDSIYSLPVRQGNYIYESGEEGHPLWKCSSKSLGKTLCK